MTATMLRLIVTPTVSTPVSTPAGTPGNGPGAAAVDVPLRIWRRAERGDWPTCDVCTWPIDPAAVVATQRTPRHPGCVCSSCFAPLGRGDAIWHAQCRPDQPTRTLRVIGGRR